MQRVVGVLPDYRRPSLFIVIAILLLFGLQSVHSGSNATTLQQAPPNKGDAALFRSVVLRMQGGERYYDAMAFELRADSYPTASVFNWRPPGMFLLLARAPGAMRVLAFLLTALAVIGTVRLFGRASAPVHIGAGILQVGAVGALLTDSGRYMPEPWSGALILLSVFAYIAGRPTAAVLFGVLAVFARELALPYAVVCFLLAVAAKRSRETALWTLGLAAFSVYYTLHAWQAIAHMPADGLAHPSWLTTAGLPFLISTVRATGWYLILPEMAALLALALMVASLNTGMAPQAKGFVAAYMVTFALIGHPFNGYWGLLTAPVWALATIYGLTGLHNLLLEIKRWGSRKFVIVESHLRKSSLQRLNGWRWTGWSSGRGVQGCLIRTTLDGRRPRFRACGRECYSHPAQNAIFTAAGGSRGCSGPLEGTFLQPYTRAWRSSPVSAGGLLRGLRCIRAMA